MPLLLQGRGRKPPAPVINSGRTKSSDDHPYNWYPTAGFDEFALPKSRGKIPVKFKRSR
jgi:hypothetical protein